MAVSVEDHNSKIKGLDSFYLNLLGIKLCIFNPNPKQNKCDMDDRQDCTIRAISKFFHKSWEDVFREMTECCIDSGCVIGCLSAITEYIANNDLESVDTIGFYSVGDFMYHHKKGKYLVMTRRHMVCYHNGKIYDSMGSIDYVNDFLIDEIAYVFTYRKKGRNKNEINGN